MVLDNFVEIISGKILNAPCISSINKFTSKLECVQIGDAFIAKNKDSAISAINRGAYAIVMDSCIEILDDEIAWILVSDIEMSILKFIKYIQLINQIEIIFFDEISFLLAKNIIKDKQISLASNIEELLESLDKKYIIINFEILLFEISYLQDSSDYLFSIISQTLFESKIEFNGEYYHLTLPNIFIKDLNNVISFCAKKFIKIILQINSDVFLPIFINTNASISQYGSSLRFVYGIDSNLAKRYIDFVNTATWGKSLCITNNYYDNIKCIHFQSIQSLKKIFQDSNYHFFIVDGVKQDEIRAILRYDIDSPSLFD